MDYKEVAQLLVDHFQSDFPLEASPFSIMAKKIGTSEQLVMETLQKMEVDGLISRIGPIYKTNRVGKSFLAACRIAPESIEHASEIINAFKEINHNYIRENDLNFWFVVTGANDEIINGVCSQIEKQCNTIVFRFKMIKPYKIDLSFNEKIDWSLV